MGIISKKNSPQTFAGTAKSCWLVNITGKFPKIKKKEIADLFQQTLLLPPFNKIPKKNREINVRLTNNREIRNINKQFRGKNKATDVISFSYLKEKIKGERVFLLGEIVISSETTIRQAKEHGITVKNELLRLAIHSLLHLLGYDHEKVPQAEAQKMRRLEKKLFKKIKLV
ncbi:MAG TPA: rRNA maturation RNase YbeY [Oligoflexia bacterium]|nr:rRNA maturation RNase YbeY [Oligoflexia bacterium]HMP26990.1 rRNA maturation RNase YbeY [Oligoflexia bacterium]